MVKWILPTIFFWHPKKLHVFFSHMKFIHCYNFNTSNVTPHGGSPSESPPIQAIQIQHLLQKRGFRWVKWVGAWSFHHVKVSTPPWAFWCLEKHWMFFVFFCGIWFLNTWGGVALRWVVYGMVLTVKLVGSEISMFYLTWSWLSWRWAFESLFCVPSSGRTM